MASEGSFHSRMYFLCPHCKKAPRSLPGHLRTACMRDRTEAEVQATVIEAKKEMSEFTHRGRFWEYQRIQDILATADPLSRLLDEMQKKGLVVRNKPPVLPSPTLPVPSLPSSAPQSPGEGANEPHVVTNVTPETAEKHYWMKTPADAFLAQSVMDQLPGKTRSGFGGASSQEERMNEQTAFDLLVQSYPVTLDGSPPKRARRHELCAEHERHCYDRWRSEQLKLREQSVLEHFGCRQPSESRVEAWIKRQGWTSNIPQASPILQQWKPYGTADSALDSGFVMKMVNTQRWKGLIVQDVPGKGRGVFTKRSFKHGEVVCDYHGRQVSREEGMKIYSSTPPPKEGKAMCIDAHEENCQCHPLTVTNGRLINHSRKRANIHPRLFVHNDRDVILFIASRDIPVNAELLFDYGLKRKSFAGEGVNLSFTC